MALDLEGDPVIVLGDRVQLQQVMLNLLHNAMEAMVDGARAGDDGVGALPADGCLRRSSRAGPFDRLGQGPGLVHVTVSDTGPGLAAGAEETVFDPFYTTKKDGMGMGLSIVRSILESHGGSIRAANHERGGAVFEFMLPLAADTDRP